MKQLLMLVAVAAVAGAMYDMTTFNGSVPACVSLVGKALRHNSAAVFAQKFAQKP
jgi:hypothetical protein